MIPLERALSKLGLASRTEARALIATGRVVVDGKVANDARTLVSLDRQTIMIDGRRAARATPRLVLFHKPRGVVTTRRDPDGRRTIFDVLGDAGRGLQAVGRLDLASTGLLLLTNDTRLADRLTDPSNRILRRYVVTVRGRVSPETTSRIERGFDVGSSVSETSFLRAKSVTIRKASNRETHLFVDLVEGKNREIRRLFRACGHEVTRVHRIAFGPYELGTLQPGQWKDVATDRR